MGGGTLCWQNTLLQLYRDKGETFFKELRGSFSGALFDKAKDKWIIYGDQIGSKFTFYAKIGDFFCCSEVMGKMYELLNENNIEYHLSIENAYLMLTYGYMIDDRTLCEEIKKIQPGCYITYQNGKVEEHRYYMLDNTPDDSIDEKKGIEIIDHYFRQAIQREFEKDVDYGYKHAVSLSGGMDSRMTSYVANDLGFTHQLNLTFSQSEYLDQTLPMLMARDLKHEWLYKNLDNGIWLFDVDEVNQTTGGNLLYYGAAHGNSLMKYVNFERLSMLHSGQLGDIIIGSWINANVKDLPYISGEKGSSQKYIGKIKDIPLKLNLKKELGCFYYRGFNGTNNGLQCIYNFTETCSPFLDLDLVENALRIPIELRQKHRLYNKWVLAKYPQAAKYVWETTGRKISAKTIEIAGHELPIANIPSRILLHAKHKLGLANLEGDDSIKHMNPMAYYIKTNTELSAFLDSYFQYADKINDNELRNVMFDIRDHGNGMEKVQVTTLLSALKLYF